MLSFLKMILGAHLVMHLEIHLANSFIGTINIQVNRYGINSKTKATKTF